MESATPGVKSTSDGWLNRYLQAQHAEHATPFRAVALTSQLPRMLQGTAPALAVSQLAQFGIRAGQSSDAVGASFEAEYAAAADAVLNGTGREAFNAIKMLKTADPSKYSPPTAPTIRAAPFGQSLRQIAQLTKSNVGLEVAFADVGGWDTHVNQGAGAGPARGAARRFLALDRGAGRRPRRSHGRHRGVDDVGVRAGGERERQPRHRSRPRQRDDGDRRRRPRRPRLRQMAGPRGRASATTAATSRSPPTSATSSARSSRDISAWPMRARCSPATPSSPAKYPGALRIG